MTILITILQDKVMEQKMTTEEIKKVIERLKNSKNPFIRRIITATEKKVAEAAKKEE